MRKMTLEERKKVVQIALDGGDPLAYLKSLGSKKPDALWYAIQSRLMDADPDKFEKLMNMRKPKEPDELPEETPAADDTNKDSGEGQHTALGIRKDGEENAMRYENEEPQGWSKYAADAEDVRPGVVSKLTHDANGLRTESWRPLDKLGITVNGLLTPAGDFQSSGGRLSWTPYANPTVSMSFMDWRLLLRYLPIVLEVMETKNDKNGDEKPEI